MGRSERNTWTERITARAWVRSNTVAGRLVRIRLSRVFGDEVKRKEGMRAGIDAARRHGQPRSATRIARRFIWRATWDASTHEGCASAVRGTVARESESESETKKEDATPRRRDRARVNVPTRQVDARARALGRGRFMFGSRMSAAQGRRPGLTSGIRRPMSVGPLGRCLSRRFFRARPGRGLSLHGGSRRRDLSAGRASGS